MSVLKAVDISKTYGGVVAVRGCSFEVQPGTVHALLGENGAGKSTLVKILTGAVHQDIGEITLDGKPVRFHDTADAARQGVAVVSQELNLFPDLDVIGNLFTKREPLRGIFFNRREMIRQAEPVLAELGLDVSPRALVGRLPLATRQLIEIAKALLTDPQVIILDEPTSALDDDSSARLLHVLSVLRDRQVGVVFVSHILEEVMQLSDVVTVLRDGAVVLAAADRPGLTMDAIVTAMLGDRATTKVGGSGVKSSAHPTVDSGKRLIARSIDVPGTLRSVDLEARQGEIVGLAGVVGAGHRELLEVLGGARAATGSLVLPDGPPAPMRTPRTVRNAVRSGVAVVSGDRKRGLLLENPIWINVAQVRSVALSRDGSILRRQRLRDRARDRVASVGIKASSVDQHVGMLSGGNQQKVVLAKWLEASPSVLLLDDPTRGVDVGSKAEMHQLLRTANNSAVVLLCSTDLDELVTLCDRVLVFRRGRIAAELRGGDLTRHSLLSEMNASETISAT